MNLSKVYGKKRNLMIMKCSYLHVSKFSLLVLFVLL